MSIFWKTLLLIKISIFFRKFLNRYWYISKLALWYQYLFKSWTISILIKISIFLTKNLRDIDISMSIFWKAWIYWLTIYWTPLLETLWRWTWPSCWWSPPSSPARSRSCPRPLTQSWLTTGWYSPSLSPSLKLSWGLWWSVWQTASAIFALERCPRLAVMSKRKESTRWMG